METDVIYIIFYIFFLTTVFQKENEAIEKTSNATQNKRHDKILN
jgi:hypothetical protein